VQRPAATDKDAWGEAVEGVQVRLRADKVQWKASETPKLIIDVRHQGDQKLVLGTVLDPVDELQVDGQSYRHPPGNLTRVRWHALNPGETRLHALRANCFVRKSPSLQGMRAVGIFVYPRQPALARRERGRGRNFSGIDPKKKWRSRRCTV
jgi:hypothetical protein